MDQLDESWSKIHTSFIRAPSAEAPPKTNTFSRMLVHAWPVRTTGRSPLPFFTCMKPAGHQQCSTEKGRKTCGGGTDGGTTGRSPLPFFTCSRGISLIVVLIRRGR